MNCRDCGRAATYYVDATLTDDGEGYVGSVDAYFCDEHTPVERDVEWTAETSFRVPLTLKWTAQSLGVTQDSILGFRVSPMGSAD